MEPQVIGGRDFLRELEGAPECLIEKIVQMYPDLPERRHTDEVGPSDGIEISQVNGRACIQLVPVRL